jgi:hypothetical protein
MDVIRGKENYISCVFFLSGKLAFPTPNKALTNFTRLALYIIPATGNRSNPNPSLCLRISKWFKVRFYKSLGCSGIPGPLTASKLERLVWACRIDTSMAPMYSYFLSSGCKIKKFDIRKFKFNYHLSSFFFFF